MGKWKTESIQKIAIDYGIVYANYGEVDEFKLGVTRGGATFEALQQIRDIEFDGRNGKSKLQARDFVDAHITGNVITASREAINFFMPYLVESGVDPAFVQTASSGAVGVIPDAQYLTNITQFVKTVDGKYKKITLYNPLNEANFSIPAAPKGEAEIAFDIYAHWEVDDAVALDDLFKIEEVDTIS